MEGAKKNAKLSVPGIVTSLISKVLAGDTDAIGLIGTSREDVN
jgi:hypothetical protein